MYSLVTCSYCYCEGFTICNICRETFGGLRKIKTFLSNLVTIRSCFDATCISTCGKIHSYNRKYRHLYIRTVCYNFIIYTYTVILIFDSRTEHITVNN